MLGSSEYSKDNIQTFTMKQKTSAISRFQDFLETQKGQTILNYLYSWGAAVVILGALFKLTHINGADLMLFLGMGTEVLTFIVNGFERQTSAKGVEVSATAGAPVIMGSAPVIAGPIAAAPMDAAASATASNAAVAVGATSSAAPQLDAEALTAMANLAAANAASNAAVAAGATSSAVPQFDAEALTAMANLAAANAAAGASTAPIAAAVPVIEGKVDVPELQQVTQDYIEQLRALTESFQHIADQSAQLEASADEVERLSRNLTSINTIYEMHLKSLGSQIGNIDQVNEQT